MPRRNELYKDKYIIAFYKEHGDDELVLVVDNPKEFAQALGVSKGSAYSILGRMFPGDAIPHHDVAMIKGKRCIAYFIENSGDGMLSSNQVLFANGGIGNEQNENRMV